MSQPRTTRAVRTPRVDFLLEHERQMQELVIQIDANARQMAELTSQVKNLAETVGTLITTARVNQTNITNQNERFEAFTADMEKRLEGLEGRERAALRTNVQNGILLGNNAVTWIVLVVAAIIGAVATGHIK